MLNYTVAADRQYLYRDGCFDIVQSKFLHWLDTLIVVQSFLAVFTFIALVGSSCWIRTIRKGAIRKFTKNMPKNVLFKNRNFSEKSKFERKIENFREKSKFLRKIEI